MNARVGNPCLPKEGYPKSPDRAVEHDEDVEEGGGHPRRHVVRHVQDHIEHLSIGGIL